LKRLKLFGGVLTEKGRDIGKSLMKRKQGTGPKKRKTGVNPKKKKNRYKDGKCDV
jgi:hypothetical protein